MRNKRLQTQAIHAGEDPNVMTGASSPELVMSSTFVVDEEISFSASEAGGARIEIDANYVDTQLAEIVKDQDLSKFVL